MKGANKALLAVAVSSDARYLATGGGSGAVHVWDVRSNTHIKSLKSHKVRRGAVHMGPGKSGEAWQRTHYTVHHPPHRCARY